MEGSKTMKLNELMWNKGKYNFPSLWLKILKILIVVTFVNPIKAYKNFTAATQTSVLNFEVYVIMQLKVNKKS